MARVGIRLEITEGQSFRHTYTFRNAVGEAYDPTTVTYKVLEPDGVLTTYTYGVGAFITKSSTGVYYVQVNADKHGHWTSRWAGTATGYADADEAVVNVVPSGVV